MLGIVEIIVIQKQKNSWNIFKYTLFIYKCIIHFKKIIMYMLLVLSN